MEYHQDRFEDRSLLIFQNRQLKAILPLEGSDAEVHSHRGLTFGGLLLDSGLAVDDIAGIFREVVQTLSHTGIGALTVREVPSFFWTSSKHLTGWGEMVLRLGLHRQQDSVFYAVPLPTQVKDRGKRWGMRKAQSQGLDVARSHDLATFWEQVLEPNLAERHAAKPIHSQLEILSLQERFPDTIQLWTVMKETEMMGGCLLFLHHRVAHCQYLSSTPAGRTHRALDLLFAKLIHLLPSDYQFLSLGTAIRQGTNLPDPGLVRWKKSWGAEAYSTFTWNLTLGEADPTT